ncbi:MAG: glutamine amidotransferase family protein [Pikeienuella sp.]
MCGIVGLFLKSDRLAPEIGTLTARMLHEMRSRGPDSAGFAVYSAREAGVKITCVSSTGATDWQALASALAERLGTQVDVQPVEDHAIFRVAENGAAVRAQIIEMAPDVTVLSEGHAIEVFKGVGDPDKVAARYGLAGRSGTHAIAHTRMATESAVTVAGSHPFSTGADTCLVHNGSLSNHNRLRRVLERAGERFQTENDSEVAAGYLAHRMRRGETLEAAIGHGISDFDGFFTFAIGTEAGFAVVRDPIACKPAVIAETDDWVAMASEFRAIAGLPEVETAEIWEPEPGRIYAWRRQEARA